MQSPFKKAIKFGITYQIIILFSVMVLLTALSIGWWSSSLLYTQLVNKEKTRLNTDAEFAGFRFRIDTEDMLNDINYLSNTASLKGFIRSYTNSGIDAKNGLTEQYWRKRLVDNFTEFAKAKRSYLQVRLIGIENNGRELIRVERNTINGQTKKVPDPQLQEKEDSQYFTSALKLPPGSVYLSDIELNVEHGKVQTPHIPVIRAVMPVNTEKREPFGIIVINLNMNSIFAELSGELKSGRDVYILSNVNNFKLQPSSRNSIGFEFQPVQQLQEIFPRLTGLIAISPENHGILENVSINNSVTVGFKRVNFDPARPDRYAAIVMAASNDSIVTSARTGLRVSILVIMLLLPIIILSGMYISYSITRPLRQIVASVQAFAKNEPDIPLPVSSISEAGILAQTFNDMKVQIQQRTELLATSEYRQRIILNSMIDGLITFNESGVIKSINPAAQKIFDYSENELLGMNIDMLIPKKLQSDLEEVIQEDFETGEIKIISNVQEITGLRRDGTSFPMDFAVSEMSLGDQRMVVGIVRDITERKKVEEALKLSEERYALAVTGSSDGLWDWNIETDEVYYSERFKELLGYSGNEFPHVLESFNNHVHPEDHDRTWQAVNKHFEDKEPFDAEYRLRTKSGIYRWYRGRGQAIWNESGKPVRMSGSVQDITDLKLAEQELKSAKAIAEEASTAKAQFLANMSHELRTPLNAIIGYSEMLKEDAIESNQEAIIPDLIKIHQAGKHLLDLISDVLDLSRIEAGRMVMLVEAFDITELVETAKSTCLPMIKEKGNMLIVKMDNDIGNMHSDPIRLRQCLLNLLSNAAKFTREGQITLQVKRFSMDDSDWIEFKITDTGIGMNPEQVNKIFTAFTQAEAKTSAKYGGAGLGLAISRNLAQLMGGDISVASEVDKGTTFTLKLPANVSGSNSETIAEIPVDNKNNFIPHAPAGDTPLVLVIDDEINAREILSWYLIKGGFRVITASSGQEGITLAKEHLPTAITLDVMMPGMDGWKVLESLKAEPILKNIPIIMCTIVDNPNRGFALGVTEYLTKPIDRDRLLRVLSNYCHGPSCKALLIEDDVNSRSIIARTLSQKGWTVHEAENGRAGMTQLNNQIPNIILLDLMMPEMDGFEFILELQQHEEWRKIPVIVITAKELSAADRDRLNGYVTTIINKKQYPEQELLENIMQQLEYVITPHQEKA